MGEQTDLVSGIQVAQDRNRRRAVLNKSIIFFAFNKDGKFVYLATNSL